MCLWHGVVSGWAQHGEFTFNSCTNGGVTRLAGTCLLMAHQCDSTGVARGGEAVLSAAICLASFWFSSCEMGPPPPEKIKK